MAKVFKVDPHPEAKEDEIFITNASDSDAGKGPQLPGYPIDKRSSWECVGWKTKRRGKIAYDTDGKVITEERWHGLFPVFAKRSELEADGFTIVDSQE